LLVVVSCFVVVADSQLKWWISNQIANGVAISNCAALWSAVSQQFPNYFAKTCSVAKQRKMPMHRCLPKFLNADEHALFIRSSTILSLKDSIPLFFVLSLSFSICLGLLHLSCVVFPFALFLVDVSIANGDIHYVSTTGRPDEVLVKHLSCFCVVCRGVMSSDSYRCANADVTGPAHKVMFVSVPAAGAKLSKLQIGMSVVYFIIDCFGVLVLFVYFSLHV